MKWQAVAINTYREAIRDKVLYNLLIFALILIGGSILLATLTISEQNKIIVDFGLASMNLFGVLMAIFLGIGLVSKEIEKKTLYTVLSKPIGRTEFLLGKYAGLLLTLAVNTMIMGVGLYLTLMINQARWGFSIWDVMDPRLIGAIYMIYFELAILTAVALLFSTFTTTTLAAIFTLSIYIMGHASFDLMKMGEKLDGLAGPLLKGIYYILPNLSYFNIKGQVAHGVAIAPSYFFYTTLYALVYCTLLMCLASFIFKRRDFN